MRYRIIIVGVCSLVTSFTYSQNRAASQLTVGATYNPLLAIIEKKQELGLSVSYSYPINKRFETGANWFVRQVIYTPDNKLKQFRNLKSSYNLESVYTGYIGTRFVSGKSTHVVAAVAGFRNELYQEILNNPDYAIQQTFKNNQWNVLYGIGYTYRYRFSDRRALSLRLFIPLNRHPVDDAIRYSIEPGIALRW